ncbi:MAG: ABC transporter ATP-binding protein [Chloroflexi bacterium]|nr:MAG: ABC transporter ATP-binding protein [Chloroflexota bacterium]
MSNLAVRVQNLGKQYHVAQQRIGEANLITQSLNLVTGPVRRMSKLLRGQATGAAELDEKFWALRDITFDVQHGEVVGIIGKNGAGKSTLLKLLSRITYLTTGRIELYGRTGSLLEVGTGFHQELTGRENVYMNGAILGMSKRDIDRRFDEIVSFAGVERFIDTPVKHYSSGMRLRLAFAVAAHLEPEILIIDEVLAVGDAEFQQKCIGKMGDLAGEGRTVLFVSHNLPVVRQLCTRGILLQDGQMVIDGTVEDALNKYLGEVKTTTGEIVWEDGIANPGVTELKVHAVRIRNHQGEVTATLDYAQPYTVEIEYELFEPLPYLRVGFLVRTNMGFDVFSSHDEEDIDPDAMANYRQPGFYKSACQVPGYLLAPGQYNLSINAGIPRRKNLCHIANALSINLVQTGTQGNTPGTKRNGVIWPLLKWQLVANRETVLNS